MSGAPKASGPAGKRELSATMTLRAFDNGYWYAEELRAFAVQLRIPSASKLRKDQLEAAGNTASHQRSRGLRCRHNP